MTSTRPELKLVAPTAPRSADRLLNALGRASPPPPRRWSLHPSALLTLDECVEALESDEASVRQLLQDAGLLREDTGLQMVVWSDVLATVGRPVARPWVSTTEAAALLGVHRRELDAVAEIAMAQRPDLVVRSGNSKKRRSFRWRADALGEAFNAGRVQSKRRQPKPTARSGAAQGRVADWAAVAADITSRR
ncbi:MAG: hypothetical protein EP330_02710 [Deltaproteobacteria bacterium]|nr:MAG: hypothetical protein EP330_02710 [Deltaproteobacteria bacterium]